MAEASPLLSVITSNVNGLNSPLKRQRLAEWTKETWFKCAVYRRLTLHPKKQTVWKWKLENRYLMQKISKRELY